MYSMMCVMFLHCNSVAALLFIYQCFLSHIFKGHRALVWYK